MIDFVRGQKKKLADLQLGSQLEVGVTVAGGPGQTIDLSAFGLDEHGKLSDDRYFIFYNQKASPCGSLTATGTRLGDAEVFRLDLDRLPASIHRIVFAATVDGAGTMATIGPSQLRLFAAGQPIVQFQFRGADFGSEKAILVAEIYRKDGWRFAAVGQGFNGGLHALLTHFGGEVVESAPAPAPSPPAPSPPPPPLVIPPPPPAAAPPLPRPAPPPAPVVPPPAPVVPPPAPAPPANAAKVNLGKVTLEKRGARQAIDLRKGGQAGAGRFHVNLNWADPNANKKRGIFGFGGGAAVDLDLGCMFALTNGTAGVIQPLGNNYGSRHNPPYIYLDKDDRSGAAADGENLYLERPELIEKVVLFALIYDGTSNFSAVDGRMTIRDDTGTEILIRLDNPDSRLLFCAVALIERKAGRLEIVKEERYFPGHRQCDEHYGFGFRWTAGSK